MLLVQRSPDTRGGNVRQKLRLQPSRFVRLIVHLHGIRLAQGEGSNTSVSWNTACTTETPIRRDTAEGIYPTSVSSWLQFKRWKAWLQLHCWREMQSLLLSMNNLSKHRWLHFSCHGIVQHTRPLDSFFQLEGDPGQLSVKDIMNASPQNAEFAYLSACHSASAGILIPDENLHLAGALQFGGYRSVRRHNVGDVRRGWPGHRTRFLQQARGARGQTYGCGQGPQLRNQKVSKTRRMFGEMGDVYSHRCLSSKVIWLWSEFGIMQALPAVRLIVYQLILFDLTNQTAISNSSPI